tara:strand:- start:2649 stop:4040 length:1392 start_codon:yes stop_codon:yes gene_type:complete
MKKLYQTQIEENPRFCSIPFTQGHITTEGEVALCCLAAYRHELGYRPNVRDEPDLQKHWTGDWYKERRQRMLDGEALPECRTCWKQDAQGPGSDRAIANKMISQHWAVSGHIDDDWDINVETGNSYNTPMWADVRPGHICNYKCRMCTPGVSDSIDNEQIEHTEVYKATGAYVTGVDPSDPKATTGLTFKDMSKWVNNPETQNSLHNWLSHNNFVVLKLVGGEPLSTPGCIQLIQWCVETGNTDFVLAITTNGSIAKGKIIRLLKYFTEVRIDFSGDSNLVLDPKVNEYQRKNANSKVMHNNMLAFMELPNCTVNYLSAVGIYNIFNIKNTLKYWYDYGMQQCHGKPVINLIEHPHEFNIELLPESDRLQIANEIDEYINSAEYKGRVIDVYQDFDNYMASTRIHLLLDRLRNPLVDPNDVTRLRKQCAKRTIAFDGIRIESFNDTLHPRLAELINEWNLLDE